jgi:hypothetical protein
VSFATGIIGEITGKASTNNQVVGISKHPGSDTIAIILQLRIAIGVNPTFLRAKELTMVHELLDLGVRVHHASHRLHFTQSQVIEFGKWPLSFHKCTF